MGQYHVAVNVTKQERLSPHPFGNGLKMWEQSSGGEGSFMFALYYLLASPHKRGGGDFPGVESGVCPNQGRWHGDRVVIVGDYAEDADVPDVPGFGSLYETGEPNPDYGAPGVDISLDIRPEVGALCGINYEGDGWAKRVREEDGSVPDDRTRIVPDITFRLVNTKGASDASDT